MTKRFPLLLTEEKKILAGYRPVGNLRQVVQRITKDVRHCYRCGESLAWRLVTSEGRRRFVCVDCRFVSYQNPKIVAATLPVRRGKIYLLRRAIQPAYGLWSFPAGYMELGETVEQAACRETWEEIRARVKLAGPPILYSYEDASSVTAVYPARVLTARPYPGPESLEVAAFYPWEIPWTRLAFRSTYHGLKDWFLSVS